MLARALAVLLTTAALLAGAGPAHADREVVTDPLGDAAPESGYTVTSTADLVRSRAVYTGRRSIDCDALVGDVDPRRDRAGIGVPDFCIGSPEWIRWGIGTRAGRPTVCTGGRTTAAPTAAPTATRSSSVGAG